MLRSKRAISISIQATCTSSNRSTRRLVNEKILKETTLTGTPEELVKRVKAMRRMGVKQIAVHGGTRAGAPKVIADFAKYVIGKG